MLIALPACQTAPTLTPLPPAPSATALPTETPTTPPTSAPLPPVTTPAPTLTPETARPFTFAIANAPNTLDPANANDESSLLITRHLYEGLTRYAPGTTTAAPALAASWEATAALTWTFHLQANVLFSDGTPFTAESARRNFERWLNAEPPGRYTFWQLMFGGFAGQTDATGAPLSNVAEVRALDELTLQIILHRPDAALPNTLAMPAFALVNPKAWASGDLGQPGAPSAGTGPFVLAHWDTAGLVQLKRNPLHWGAPPAPAELIFKTIADDTQRLLALHTGEVEGMASVNPNDYATVKNDSALRLEWTPSLGVLYLGFNQARAPWNVRECRQAAAFALDKPRYAQMFFPGDAQVAEALLLGAAITPSMRDATQAHALWELCLASSPSAPLTATLYVPPLARPYLPDPAGLGAAIQTDLSALSLTIQIKSPDWQTQWLPDVQNGRADLFLLGWTGVNGDPDSALCPLFCGAHAMFNSDGKGNPLPPDVELAEWLRLAQATTDATERERLYALAQARVWNEVIVIPLARRDNAWAYRANVTGLTPSPIEATFFSVSVTP